MKSEHSMMTAELELEVETLIINAGEAGLFGEDAAQYAADNLCQSADAEFWPFLYTFIKKRANYIMG